jgi:hypothetical protein
MAYTAIDDSEAYFQVKTYTGTGSAASITLDGDTDMQPDFVWIKIRSTTNQHRLLDSIRGATNELYSDLTSREETTAQGLTAFDSDGFSLGTDHGFNKDTETFVAWCWKASGSTASNGSGDITSTVDANTTAGFSIVSYTGDGSTGTTVGHGLGVVPKMIIIKNLTESSRHWQIYHESIGNTHYFQFDTNAKLDDAGCFDDTSPTSSVFTLGSANRGNEDTKSFIAYCFAEKQGYSKFGSYVGNSSTDGTFVYTGFSPSFLMIKCTSGTEEWWTWDNKRNTYNVVNKALHANDGDGVEDSDSLDFLSNGFKMRVNSGARNATDTTYTYMAFAEAPFVNSNGVPCNAR